MDLEHKRSLVPDRVLKTAGGLRYHLVFRTLTLRDKWCRLVPSQHRLLVPLLRDPERDVPR